MIPLESFYYGMYETGTENDSAAAVTFEANVSLVWHFKHFAGFRSTLCKCFCFIPFTVSRLPWALQFEHQIYDARKAACEPSRTESGQRSMSLLLAQRGQSKFARRAYKQKASARNESEPRILLRHLLGKYLLEFHTRIENVWINSFPNLGCWLKFIRIILIRRQYCAIICTNFTCWPNYHSNAAAVIIWAHRCATPSITSTTITRHREHFCVRSVWKYTWPWPTTSNWRRIFMVTWSTWSSTPIGRAT